MKELIEGVFCETEWEGANVGAMLGEDGFALVESPMLPRDAREWKKYLSEASDRPILYVINTDYHFDHIMTNCLLGGRVIAHLSAEPAFRLLAGAGERADVVVAPYRIVADEMTSVNGCFSNIVQAAADGQTWIGRKDGERFEFGDIGAHCSVRTNGLVILERCVLDID